MRHYFWCCNCFMMTKTTSFLCKMTKTLNSRPNKQMKCILQFYMCNHDKLFMYCRALWWYKWVWLIAALFLVLQQFYDDKNDFFYGWQSRFWPKKAQYRHKRDCRNRKRKKEEKKIEISSCYPISPLLELY